MHLVISTNTKPNSRSRILAGLAFDELCRLNEPADLIDLQDYVTALQDDDEGRHELRELAARITAADSVLLAVPIYHYDVCSTAKHLIELTAMAWRHKVVGFLCTASSRRNYMSIMSLANSLMLESRCMIVPYLVFTTPKSFEGDLLEDHRAKTKIEELAVNTCQWAAASTAIRESRQIRRSH